MAWCCWRRPEPFGCYHPMRNPAFPSMPWSATVTVWSKSNGQQPNVLTVLATVNGRRMSLIVDTGWSEDGITLQSDSMPSSQSPTEQVKEFGTTASGAKLMNFRKARADRVTMGNVELTQVPLFFGNLQSLQGKAAQKVGANGFIGAGFLNTCSAIIDLHNLRLYLRPPGKGRRAIVGPALRAIGLSEAPLLPGCFGRCANQWFYRQNDC